MKQILTLSCFSLALATYGQLSNGLIAYYPFNNGNTENQAPTSFSTLFAQQTTPTANAMGVASQALAFSGSAPQLWVNSNGLIDFGLTTSFSFVTDFKSGSSANQEFFSDLLISGVGWKIGFFNNTGHITFETGAGATAISVHTTTVYNDLAWHQVALLVDKSALNIRIYVDGELQDLEGTVCGASVAANTIDIGTCNFNANENNDQLTDFGGGLQGALDEIRLYGRLLTEGDVEQAYTLSFGGTVALEPVAGSQLDHRFDPVSGMLVVNAPFASTSSLTVFDARGRIVSERTGVGQMALSLNGSAGLLFVRLVNDGRVWTARLPLTR